MDINTPLFETGEDFAHHLDAIDPLAAFRSEFIINDPEEIYLDGNSLGRLPRCTLEKMNEITRDGWGNRLIRSWNEGWWDAPQRVGEKIARLIGAAPGQVIISDSTSVNLYKLVMAALEIRPERTRMISDVLNFPSDLYILQGCQRTLGNRHTIHLLQSDDGITIDMKRVLDEINEETALVTLSHTVFKSGFMYDAKKVTARAHEAGAIVLWDLSHSVGAVPVDLDEWQADFAIGCTYKYLNGGPGSPAFLYINKERMQAAISPMQGWWGEASPFEFQLQYQPADNITRFQCGTLPMLSLLAMEQSLELTLAAGMDALRKKSLLLSSYLIYLYDQVLEPYGFRLGSPRNPEQRGSHISLRHADGYRINKAMIEGIKVIPDFREPDNIRIGLTPLYTSFFEVWQAVDRICKIMEAKKYLEYSTIRHTVT